MLSASASRPSAVTHHGKTLSQFRRRTTDQPQDRRRTQSRSMHLHKIINTLARCLTGIVSEPTVFERSHQLLRYTLISSAVMWCVWSSFANLSSISRITLFLAEHLVADEPVVDTQEILLLAFLLERIRDEVLVIPWLLPVTVPVGSPFLFLVIRNREQIHGVLDKCSVLLRSVAQEVSARAIDDAHVPV